MSGRSFVGLPSHAWIWRRFASAPRRTARAFFRSRFAWRVPARTASFPTRLAERWAKTIEADMIEGKHFRSVEARRRTLAEARRHTVVIAIGAVVHCDVGKLTAIPIFSLEPGNPARTAAGRLHREDALNSDIALGLMSQMLKLALLLSLPLLGVIVLVSLLISVLQVVTQVQDASIAFVPKLVLFVVVLGLVGPWMLDKLVGYGVSMFERLAH